MNHENIQTYIKLDLKLLIFKLFRFKRSWLIVTTLTSVPPDLWPN